MTRLLRLKQVLATTGKSRSSVYADPSFPRPISIGQRSVAWVEDEVMAWVDQRISNRDQQIRGS